ncbi:MAG: hypothetical protein HKP40_07385 [Litoreibacter sp.]|nr:hypothetical protein [Litoreibacter sp.]
MIKKFSSKRLNLPGAIPVRTLTLAKKGKKLVLSEVQTSGRSRQAIFELLAGIFWVAVSFVVFLIPDAHIGGPDATLVRFLVIPATAGIGWMMLTKFWHDWHNVLTIDHDKASVRHHQVNRRGRATGELVIPFDDLTIATIQGPKQKEQDPADEKAAFENSSLMIHYDGKPGRLLALSANSIQISSAQELIDQEILSKRPLGQDYKSASLLQRFWIRASRRLTRLSS